MEGKLYIGVSAFLGPDTVELKVTTGPLGQPKQYTTKRTVSREEWEFHKEWAEGLLGERKWYVDTRGPRFIYMSIFGSI